MRNGKKIGKDNKIFDMNMFNFYRIIIKVAAKYHLFLIYDEKKMNTIKFIKNFIVFLFLALASALLGDGLFETGQEARVILGAFADGADNRTTHIALRAMSDGTRLYVADTRNNRVLIWNSIPQTNYKPADIVVGQPNFETNNAKGGPDGLNWPVGVYSDGTRLFITDTNNDRVLIWNEIPTKNGEPADIVLGQNNFENIRSVEPIYGPCALHNPWDVCFDGKRLYVVSANRGVYIWNNLPTYNNQPANLILGKKDFWDEGSQQPNPWNLHSPMAIATDGKRIVVSDYTFHRILVWNSIPTHSGQDADIVLGANDFYSYGGSYPIIVWRSGLWIHDDMLFSAGGETYVWNNFPTINNEPPDAKLHYTLSDGVCYDGKYLIVANHANSRILVYDELPSSVDNETPSPAPMCVIGQPDENTNTMLGKKGFGEPWSVCSTGKKLLIAGDMHARIVLHQDIPTTDGEKAENLISLYDWGDIKLNSQNDTYLPLSQIGQMWSDGIRLMVADRTNGILVWNRIPENDNIFSDFTICPNGNCGNTRINEQYIWGMTSDGEKLFVNDWGNERILIWNSIPLENESHNPNIIINLDFEPNYIATDGTHLAVTGHGGVRIWNTIPTENDQPPDFILIGNTSNPINGATGVHIHNNSLYVAEADGNRVLVFNAFPTNSTQIPDAILGQNNQMSRVKGCSRSEMLMPKSIWFDGETLWGLEHKFADRLLGFKADIVSEIPQSPTSLTITNVKNHSARLSWQENSDNVRNYTLYSKKGDSQEYTILGYPAANVNHISLTSLEKNTIYAFRMSAENSFGGSDFSQEVTFTTANQDSHSPSQPNSPYPDGSIEHNAEWFSFNWECTDPDPGDELKYDFYLGQTEPPPLFAKNLASNCFHANYVGLAGGSTYFWKIVAKDMSGNIAVGPVWSFSTSGHINRAYLTIQNSSHGVTNPPFGSWEFSSDYYTYTHAFPDSMYQFFRWEGDIPDSLQFNNPLYIKLEKNNNIKPLFQVAEIPAQPKQKSPADSSFVSADDIHLQWHNSQLAERYFTSISTDTDFFNIIHTDTIKIDTTLTIDHLTDGERFYWKLFADNTIGQSKESETWLFYTRLNKPDELAAILTDSNYVHLSWKDNSENEIQFQIERKSGSSSHFVVIDTVEANCTTYIDSTVQDSSTYSYRLLAVNELMPSEYCNTVEITTNTTKVDKYLSSLPTEYCIYQNYPNPFNLSTTIRYDLPNKSEVQLTLYNIKGETIKTLVNKIQGAGRYDVSIYANDLASGLYIYCLCTYNDQQKFKETRKFILIK